MRYLEISFLCRMTATGQFSAYKGSMLRGCLGSSLRRGLCMTRQKDCLACILARNCIYPRIFSPLPAPRQAVSAPFCLEPDLADKSIYEAGELFGFKLKLFSFACEYLPFFAQAFRMTGEKGMGSPKQPGTFVIEQITSRGQQLYDAENDNLAIPECQKLPDPCAPTPNDATNLRLSLITPLRHKAGNRFSARLEFADLFNLILRRLKALKKLDGHAWQLDRAQYAKLRAEAANVRITANSLRWQDWTRYSSRQETLMKFGGLAGSISYSGNVGIFVNLLHIAGIAHIGKQTSFGLGAIDFELSRTSRL